MNFEDISETYQTLDIQTKQVFLAKMVFYLSQAARSVYPEATEGSISSILVLKAINELVHRTAAQLSASMDIDVAGYPDLAFWQIIGESCHRKNHENLVLWAIGKAWEDSTSI